MKSTIKLACAVLCFRRWEDARKPRRCPSSDSRLGTSGRRSHGPSDRASVFAPFIRWRSTATAPSGSSASGIRRSWVRESAKAVRTPTGRLKPRWHHIAPVPGRRSTRSANNRSRTVRATSSPGPDLTARSPRSDTTGAVSRRETPRSTRRFRHFLNSLASKNGRHRSPDQESPAADRQPQKRFAWGAKLSSRRRLARPIPGHPEWTHSAPEPAVCSGLIPSFNQVASHGPVSVTGFPADLIRRRSPQFSEQRSPSRLDPAPVRKRCLPLGSPQCPRCQGS
jgi:hypothetical protein